MSDLVAINDTLILRSVLRTVNMPFGHLFSREAYEAPPLHSVRGRFVGTCDCGMMLMDSDADDVCRVTCPRCGAKHWIDHLSMTMTA